MPFRIQAALTALLLSLTFLGCGGSSGKGVDPPPPVVAPAISQQPQNQVVWAPAAATFAVQATGTAPLAYQWTRNGANIPDAILNTYTTALTSVDDHGTVFAVKVSNSAGAVTSTSATLSVNQLPVVMQHPEDIVTLEGEDVAFSARGQGTPVLAYQWKRNGTPIPGATGSTFSIAKVTRAENQTLYSAVISNGLGSVETRQATLQVGARLTPPSISIQPIGGTASIGQSLTLVVEAMGTPPFRYQWRKNAVNIPGATSATFTLSDVQAVDAGTYSVVVSNDAGSATSVDAVITVLLTAPLITTQPALTWTGTGQTATFTVVAAGSPPMQYQWLRNGVDVPGAVFASYTTPVAVLADDGTKYKVKITNPAATVFSDEVLLRVFDARTITGQAGTYWWSETGTTFAPRDLRATSVEALQLDGGVGFFRYPGTGAADGTFQVPGLPPGPYFLILGGDTGRPPSCLWMVHGDPDFSEAALGRADRTLVTGDQTSLAVTITGPLRNLTKGLSVYVPTLGVFRSLTGTAASYPFPWAGLPLLVADKDSLWTLSQKVEALPEGQFTSLEGAIEQAAPEMKTLGSTQVTAALPLLDQTVSTSLAVDAAAYAAPFAQIQPAIDPQTGRGALELTFGAQPAGGSLGVLQPWAPLFTLVRSATADLPATAFQYPDPYPAGWKRALQVRQRFSFDLTLPGSAGILRVDDAIEDIWPVGSIPSGPLAPGIHAVTQPKIGTSSLFAPPASVGVAPILSWKVQSPDSPSFYRVTVFQVLPDTKQLVEKIQYVTAVTSQKITPGILETGKYYLARIQTVYGDNHDSARPFFPSWPRSTVPVYSGIFTP
jgi:hypothetical protein